MSYIDVVFEKPQHPKGGCFVEVENEKGESIRIGEWIDRGDGFVVLRIPQAVHTHQWVPAPPPEGYTSWFACEQLSEPKSRIIGAVPTKRTRRMAKFWAPISKMIREEMAKPLKGGDDD